MATEHESLPGEVPTALERGLSFCRARAWERAYRALSQADAEHPLAVEHLGAFVLAAGLTGRDDEYLALQERLYALHLEAGERVKAAEAAFWKGFRLFAMGERAQGSGWLARAERLVEGESPDCRVRGYLEIAKVRGFYGAGDYEAAFRAATRAAEIGEASGDPDLTAFAHNLMGRTLLRQGRIADGLRLQDEAMVAATTGELSPVVTALIYCGAIASCSRIYALERTREWTSALAVWCDAQPELVAFTGPCRVMRAEILQVGGDWKEALAEASEAAVPSGGSPPESVAEAHYRQAEIHRLRGELEAAEEAYRAASQLGRDPQPGLSLLWLARGRVDAASAAIRRALGSTEDPLERARLAPAAVEVFLGAGALDEARAVIAELDTVARDVGTEALTAMADHARGALLLAGGDARSAVPPLRRAFLAWQRLGAPYVAARIRVTLARACHALADCDTAELEVAAAREVFVRLGAAPDLAALDAFAAGNARRASSAPADQAHGLTSRELEVLRLVASGKTNKLIARELGVSEKTVDRHVSNIFAKIDVPSRAAATAFAYEHALV